MRIIIAIPHNHPNWNKVFIASKDAMIQMFHSYNYKTKADIELFILTQNEGSIEQMRNVLAEGALKYDATHILWIDTDMTFPPDMIIKMIEHFKKNDKLEAITGLYTYKTPPFRPHIYHKLNRNGKYDVAGAFSLNKTFKVEGAGFGCIMIKADVFSRVERPWFTFSKKYGIINYGEDLFFCKNAKMNMICDPTIVCGHLIEQEVSIGHYIDYNGLKIANDKDEMYIKATKEQLKEIEKKHKR